MGEPVAPVGEAPSETSRRKAGMLSTLVVSSETASASTASSVCFLMGPRSCC